jgi:hypothetical protein
LKDFGIPEKNWANDKTNFRGENMRCGSCGSKNIELKDAFGKTFMYKRWDVKLRVGVNLYTCTDCDEILMKPGCAKRLDEACERTLAMNEADFTSSLRAKGLDW